MSADSGKPKSDKPEIPPETTALHTTPPNESAFDLMRPPIEEIDQYLRQRYRQPDIEVILRRDYKRSFRAVIRERARIAQTTDSHTSSVDKPVASPAPTVAQKLADETPIKYPENAANLNGQTPPTSTGNPASGSHGNPPATPDADLALGPLKAEVEGLERRKLEMKHNLELLGHRNRLANELGEIEEAIRREERNQLARRMPYSEVDYSNGMRAWLSEKPEIMTELRSQFAQMGWSSDFDRQLDRLIREQFQLTNRAASSFPRITRRLGYVIDSYPFDVEDEWETILTDLRNDVSSQRYAGLLSRLQQLRPSPICTIDHTPLRHLSGSSFVCSHGHAIAHQCPDCGSALIFDGHRFDCPECIRRFIM